MRKNNRNVKGKTPLGACKNAKPFHFKTTKIVAKLANFVSKTGKTPRKRNVFAQTVNKC